MFPKAKEKYRVFRAVFVFSLPLIPIKKSDSLSNAKQSVITDLALGKPKFYI